MSIVSQEWEKMTPAEQEGLIAELKGFLERELNLQKQALEKAIQEKPAQVSMFLFINGRLPTHDELIHL